MADGTDKVETGLASQRCSCVITADLISELGGFLSTKCCFFLFIAELSEGTVLRSLALWTLRLSKSLFK